MDFETIKDFYSNASMEDIIIGLKFISLFVIFVVGIVIDFKIIHAPPLRRIFFRNEWKRETARSRGNVIKGTLTSVREHKYRREEYNPKNDSTSYNYEKEYSAVYSYVLDGREKKYKVRFKYGFPPQIIDLMYLNSPRRLFTYEEGKTELWTFLVKFLVGIMPLFMGALAAYLLGLTEVVQ